MKLLYSLSVGVLWGFVGVTQTVHGQELPYAVAYSLHEAAQYANQVEGLNAGLAMTHSREGDKRPFKVTLRGPDGYVPIPIAADGSFDLPILPPEQRPSATLVHNLEKGALRIDVAYGISLAGESWVGRTISEVCSGIAKKFREIEPFWEIIGTVRPEFRELQVAIVGLALTRIEPEPGRLQIRRQGETVKTIDLTKTGPILLLFDEFPPNQHSVAWDLPKATPPPRIHLVFQAGPELKDFPNAIFIRNGPDPMPEGREQGAIRKSGYEPRTTHELPLTPVVSTSNDAVASTPFRNQAHAIPGKIEAEHFDEGEPEQAYHDVDEVNHGADYRDPTQVDIEKRSDASNGHGIGWTRKGEWLNYTVEVKESGVYGLEMPVASNKLGGVFHLEIRGRDITGPIQIPDTGGWQILKTIKIEKVNLTKGRHVIRAVMDRQGPSGSIGDIDYFEFTLSKK